MDEPKKKISKPMMVTMDEDEYEYEKFKRGETHSKSGVRRKDGSLSALPDIAILSEEDMPTREVVKTETVYIQPPKPSAGRKIAATAGEVALDVLSDPEVQEDLWLLGKTIWHYKIHPKIKGAVSRIKTGQKPRRKIKATDILEMDRQQQIQRAQSRESSAGKIEVNKKQAEAMIEATKEKARELAEMLYFLSKISVKDSKTKEEYALEQSYLKQLVSAEATDTIQKLIENGTVLDQETVVIFSDFLKGYIHSGDKLIPLPSLE